MTGEINPVVSSPAVKVEQTTLPQRSRAKAIEYCKEHYPKEYKWRRILTLAIAIVAIALLVIPAIATGLTALSLCSFGIGLLITTPIALFAITVLIKKIDDRTLYWSGNLARLLIEKKEKEAQEAAKKASHVQVKTA